MSYELAAATALVLAASAGLAAFGYGKYQSTLATAASDRATQARKRERFSRPTAAPDCPEQPETRVKRPDFGRR